MPRLTASELTRTSRRRDKLLLFVLGSSLIASISVYLTITDFKAPELYAIVFSLGDANESAEKQQLARRWLFDERTLPTPLPQRNDPCSCWNRQARAPCCERVFRRAHKMGYMLTDRLFRTRRFHRFISKTQEFRKFPAQTDFRDVVLVRNFYESIISGYLYHKRGNECWMDHVGRQIRPREKWNNYNFQIFSGGEKAYIQYDLEPPANADDTLCHYLANNTEPIGMRAYMSWILNNGYEGVLRSFVLNMFDPSNRTMFVCYEDLSNPQHDMQVLEKSLDWWFPTGHEVWDGRKPARDEVYTGVHATSHDSELRSRLYNLIQELDDAYFEGVVAWASSLFPC